MMELGTLERFAQCLSEVASLTTDMGTESGLPSFRIKSLWQCFTPWMQKSLETSSFKLQTSDDDDGDLPFHDDSLEVWPNPRSLLPNALATPGTLHILSNLQQDLSSSLKHWGEHVKRLKLVQPLLAERHYRERLVFTCLQGCASVTSAFYSSKPPQQHTQKLSSGKC